MSITIKRTFGDPGGGNGRAFSCACLIQSPTQSDAPRIATIAMAAGKLTRTNRRKPARCAQSAERAARRAPAPRPTRPDCRSAERQPGWRVRGRSRPEPRVTSQRPRLGQTKMTPHPTSPASGKRRDSRAGSARRSGGSSCRDDPGSNTCLRSTIVPTSSKPATSPHQADRSKSEMRPEPVSVRSESRRADRSGLRNNSSPTDHRRDSVAGKERQWDGSPGRVKKKRRLPSGENGKRREST